MTETYRFGRQRLAWFILFGSFFACLLLSTTAPLALRAFVQNATQPLDITVQANQGTVGVRAENGPGRAVLMGEPPQEIEGVTTIQTDTTASALVNVMPPDGDEPLATFQVSGNSTVQIEQATAPRFGISNQPFQMNLDVQAGRVRLYVPFFEERPVAITLATPHGQAEVNDPGRYIVEVGTEATQVTVQSDGAAVVTAQGESVNMSPGQRLEIPAGAPPRGPLDPARDLIRNGDFSQGLDNWSSFAWQVELPDQPKGETSVTSGGGGSVLRFDREGVGHADVRVAQSINQDVSGYDTLRVSATLRVLNQSLGVCGVQGSECPLFVIVNYIDDSGVARVWQHGFFAQGTVDDNVTPGQCISCAVVQRPHERVPLGQFFFYDVDLIQELASQGFLPPRHIESVTLVGSGHTFTTEVSDVALIVE